MEQLWICIAMEFHWGKRPPPRLRECFVQEVKSTAKWNNMSVGGYLYSRVR